MRSFWKTYPKPGDPDYSISEDIDYYRLENTAEFSVYIHKETGVLKGIVKELSDEIIDMPYKIKAGFSSLLSTSSPKEVAVTPDRLSPEEVKEVRMRKVRFKLSLDKKIIHLSSVREKVSMGFILGGIGSLAAYVWKERHSKNSDWVIQQKDKRYNAYDKVNSSFSLLDENLRLLKALFLSSPDSLSEEKKIIFTSLSQIIETELYKLSRFFHSISVNVLKTKDRRSVIKEMGRLQNKSIMIEEKIRALLGVSLEEELLKQKTRDAFNKEIKEIKDLWFLNKDFPVNTKHGVSDYHTLASHSPPPPSISPIRKLHTVSDPFYTKLAALEAAAGLRPEHLRAPVPKPTPPIRPLPKPAFPSATSTAAREVAALRSPIRSLETRGASALGRVSHHVHPSSRISRAVRRGLSKVPSLLRKIPR